MPYPNEHSCRLESPDKYDKFARKNCDIKHDGKCIDVIYGIKEGKSEIQAFRYPKDSWEVDAARNQCKDHDGSFEAASESKSFDVNEKRSFNFKIEKREKDTEKLIGHAAVFNEYADILWWQERIIPGAFKDSIKTNDIRALFNHDPNYVLGRNKSGTLKLREDEQGLAIEINPPDTQFANDLIKLIERGDISQMSFAFQVLEDKWEYGEEKEPDKRDIMKVKLYDVSPVTYPAYEGTDVAIRSHYLWLKTKKVDVIPYKIKLMKRRLDLIHTQGGS